MKAILYFGHLGSTKQAGEILANQLDNVELIDGTNIKKIDLSLYDVLIFGINIRMGKLNKKFLKFIKKFQKQNLEVQMYAYIVGADKSMQSKYIDMARALLPKTALVIYAGGVLNPDNAKGLSKAVITNCIKQFKAQDLALPSLEEEQLAMLASEIEKNKIPIS